MARKGPPKRQLALHIAMEHSARQAQMSPRDIIANAKQFYKFLRKRSA